MKHGREARAGGGGVRRLYRGAVGAVASTRPGALLLRHSLPRVDRLALRLSGGRRNVTNHAVPTLVLTTTGRRSGAPRPQPLCYVRDGDSLVVVGTNWGQARHPAWTSNLRACGRATATVDGRQIAVDATEVTGPEWETYYRRFEAMSRNYVSYRSWCGDRTPRIFRLVPVG